MEMCTASHNFVFSMGAKILPMWVPKCVLGQGLEDWFAIPGSNNPSGNVLHELSFFVTVAANLLQVLTIAFGVEQGK